MNIYKNLCSILYIYTYILSQVPLSFCCFRLVRSDEGQTGRNLVNKIDGKIPLAAFMYIVCIGHASNNIIFISVYQHCTSFIR